MNKFVEEHGIIDVLEWGCGDGNQLSLAKYPRYIGIDVSKTAVNMCCQKYMGDDTKQFIWCGENEFHNTILTYHDTRISNEDLEKIRGVIRCLQRSES